jgi:hypothetical protein
MIVCASIVRSSDELLGRSDIRMELQILPSAYYHPQVVSKYRTPFHRADDESLFARDCPATSATNRHCYVVLELG